MSYGWLLAGAVGQSPHSTHLPLLRRVRYRLNVLALELLAACPAARDPLCVGFARFPIIEKIQSCFSPVHQNSPQIWGFCSHEQYSVAIGSSPSRFLPALTQVRGPREDSD